MTKLNTQIHKISWERLGREWRRIAKSYPFGMPADVCALLFRQAEKHIIGSQGLTRSLAETHVRRMDITSLAFDAGISRDTIAKACRERWGTKWTDILSPGIAADFRRMEPWAEPKQGKN